MSPSVARELNTIRSMPYGTARIAAAEAIARRIEAEGPQQHLAEALLDLVEAYTFAGQGAKSFVVFARLLRLWDESPELFDVSDEHNLFWEFKWVASDLSDFPQISRAQAEAFLDDMGRRFDLQGSGSSAVAMSRFSWAWHSGSPEAEASRLAWITTQRDEYDDCRACTIGQQVDFFTEQGRWQEALALGLTQDSSCNLEPAKTHHAVALSALLAGDPGEALRSHRLARATLDAASRDLAQSRGQGFELLARGGHLDRALRELRSDYPELLEDPPSPLFHLRFLLGVLAGLSAQLSADPAVATVPTGLPDPAMRTVAALHDWAAEQVRRHVAAFDRRNGTDYYATLEARALAATMASAPLRFEPDSDEPNAAPSGSGASAGIGDDAGEPGPPAGVTGGSADDGPTAPAAGRTDPPEPTDPLDPERLLARAEALAARGAHTDAAPVYADAARRLEAQGWLVRAGLAYAEAAQCAALGGDEPGAHLLFGEAVPRLRAGDAPAEAIVAVLTAWAPVATRMADAGAQIRATAELLDGYGEFDRSGLTEELAERRHAEWAKHRATLRDTLARSAAAAGSAGLPEGIDLARAAREATTAGEEYARLGLIGDASHAFWLAGRVHRGLGDSDAAIWSLESAVEGFTAIGRRAERAEAAGELIEVLRATGRDEQAETVVRGLTA